MLHSVVFDTKFLQRTGLDPESISRLPSVLGTHLVGVRLISTNKKFAARLEDDQIAIDQTRDSFATRIAKFFVELKINNYSPASSQWLDSGTESSAKAVHMAPLLTAIAKYPLSFRVLLHLWECASRLYAP
jgi:hypothetical protein